MTRRTPRTLPEAIAELRELADESINAQDVLQQEAGRAQRKGDNGLMRTLLALAARHTNAFHRRTSAVYRLVDLMPSHVDEKIGTVTVRRCYSAGRLTYAMIYNSTGWLDTTVTTEAGVLGAAARLNKRDGV